MLRFKLFIFIFLAFTATAQNTPYLTAKVLLGEGAYSLLERFGLDRSSKNLNAFKELNNLSDLNLYLHKEYKLPIRVYNYNAVSIRSTLNINDWDYAVSIQKYNERMHQAGVKSKDYRDDNVLWVPEALPVKTTVTNNARVDEKKPNTQIHPIFGKKYEKVDVTSNRLKGHVYYVIPGHGGPDPGAIGKHQGHMLCEDEYAYDISLRLARNLIQHGATVYVIVQDPDDGIRDEAILKPDKDEVCYPNQEIPLNQIKRLNQRVDIINSLFNQHKKAGAKKQRAIEIHLDSRGSNQRVDMFFYHSPKSKAGKQLAESIKNTIASKYARHQRGRGYSGTVSARNLHMLRETYPVMVFAELGNIRNELDQRRFLIYDNRQAVANWICEGILNDD
jgi:N-acetylmuramoyl-L-alanine amidase